jgi:hypothetical protein|tara:strand:+ start:286 stop:1248 length:963 start_codon:yes stop_codon:yes gene_type:complete
MNKNTIAIVAFNKPDLLYLYLEQIFSEPTIENYQIQIHTENGYDKEQDNVLKYYKDKFPKSTIFQVLKPNHGRCPLPGFHNILTTYLYAADATRAGDFLIVGEEDMIPTQDYVRYNKYIYDNYLKKYPRIMGAAHKRRAEAEKQGDPELLLGDYQCTSLSVISTDTINKYLKPVLSDPLLYSNPHLFYGLKYPLSRIAPLDHTHHDGAIERIMDDNKLFVLKPDQSRSMHVGLSGVFCKGKAPEGTFEERVSEWRELIKDGDKLRSLSNLPEDLVVTDPKGPEWDKLTLDLERDKCKASSWWYDPSNEFKEYIETVNTHK